MSTQRRSSGADATTPRSSGSTRRRSSLTGGRRPGQVEAAKAVKQVLSDLSLTPQAIGIDLGLTACYQLENAVSMICNGVEKRQVRVSVAEALIHLHEAEPELKHDPLRQAAPRLLAFAQEVLQLPDDEITDDIKGVAPYEFGLQRLPEYISRFILVECNSDPEFANFVAPTITDLLWEVRDAALSEVSRRPNAHGAGPRNSREASIIAFLKALPKEPSVELFGTLIPAACAIISHNGHIDGVCRAAVATLLNMQKANSDAVAEFADQLLECAKTGGGEMVMAVLAEGTAYQRQPEVFHENLEALLSFDVRVTGKILQDIAATNPEELEDVLGDLVELLAKPEAVALCLGIVQQLASSQPKLLSAHVGRIFQLVAQTDSSASVWPTIQAVAGVDAQSRLAVINLCCQQLANVTGNPTLASELLRTLLKLVLVDEVAARPVLAEHRASIDALRSVQSKVCNQLVDIIDHAPEAQDTVLEKTQEDSAEGTRAVSPALFALDPLRRLNKEVYSSCATFSEVVNFLRENSVLLEEAVSLIHARLPRPSRVSFTSRTRRTLVIVVTCPQTGQKFQVESKQWEDWLRIALAEVILGHEIFDSDTMALLAFERRDRNKDTLSPVEAIEAIYEAYRGRSADSVDQFFRHPLPNVQEQEAMEHALRQVGFYSKFSFNAEAGDWCAPQVSSPRLPSRRGSKHHEPEEKQAPQRPSSASATAQTRVAELNVEPARASKQVAAALSELEDKPATPSRPKPSTPQHATNATTTATQTAQKAQAQQKQLQPQAQTPAAQAQPQPHAQAQTPARAQQPASTQPTSPVASQSRAQDAVQDSIQPPASRSNDSAERQVPLGSIRCDKVKVVQTKDGYLEYLVEFSVQGHRRSVSHRFKEFEVLDKELRQSFKPPCSLPAKVYQGKIDQAFLDDKIEGLEKYLRGLFSEPEAVNSKVLHTFLGVDDIFKLLDDPNGNDAVKKRGSSTSLAFTLCIAGLVVAGGLALGWLYRDQLLDGMFGRYFRWGR